MVDTWGTMSETVTLAVWASGFVGVGLVVLLRSEGITLVGL